MAFQWTDDLKTGNTTIDEEHRQLIDALNSLLEACSKGKGRAELEKTSKFLCDYTVRHFSHEEQLQTQYRYPDMTNHKKYHAEFTKVVDNIAAELKKDGPTIALVGKVNSSVGGWLLNHIKREDTKVAAHIRAQG